MFLLFESLSREWAGCLVLLGLGWFLSKQLCTLFPRAGLYISMVMGVAIIGCIIIVYPALYIEFPSYTQK